MSAANEADTRALVRRAEAIAGPVRITSLGRTPTSNVLAGGSGTSQHLSASAADVVPLQGGGRAWFDAVRSALPADSYGQLIYYPSDGHVHISLPNRASGRRGEQLVANVGPGFTTLAQGIGPGQVADTPDGAEGAATWARRGVLVGALVLGAMMIREVTK